MIVFDAEALAAESTPLRVRQNTIDVWEYSLACPAQLRQWCIERVSDAERERAARFVFSGDRDEYLVAHGMLRHLLGRYSGMPASQLRFTFGAAGKPALATTGEARIAFNLAHSGGRALLAVSCGGEVGVDLEKDRFDIEILAIARRFFFGGERRAIESERPDRQHETFLRYWAAKEAVLKGQGVGLSFPLNRFNVEFDSCETRARAITFDQSQLAPDWTIQMLPLEETWAGAVAARGEDWEIRMSDTPGTTVSLS